MTCIFIVHKFYKHDKQRIETKKEENRGNVRKALRRKESKKKKKKRYKYKIPVGLFSLRGDLLGYLSTEAATCYFTESLKCAFMKINAIKTAYMRNCFHKYARQSQE